jgi:hypothetical protein
MNNTAAIRRRLRERHQRSLASWCAWRNEPYSNTLATLRRCSEEQRKPKGESGQRIVQKLSMDLGVTLFNFD